MQWIVRLFANQYVSRFARESRNQIKLTKNHKKKKKKKKKIIFTETDKPYNIIDVYSARFLYDFNDILYSHENLVEIV